jgi:hypothetical protein
MMEVGLLFMLHNTLKRAVQSALPSRFLEINRVRMRPAS